MSSFQTIQISPPGFRICMPMSSDMDAERYVCQINIRDLERWKYEITPKRRANQMDRVSQSTGAIKGKWILTNSSFPLDEAMDPSEYSPVPIPDSPASASSCDSPMYTLEEISLFMPGEQDDDIIDAKTIAERMKTSLILEGKLTPPPCRDYEGPLAACFRVMAIEEERDGIRRTVLGSIRETPQSRLAKDAPKGWEHLYPIIYDGLRGVGRFRFPRYHPGQRAYLLTREYKSVMYIVCKIRNLSACSQREIMKLFSGIEDKGRNDMIYIANQGEEIPYRFDLEELDHIDWRGSP
ncbi:hypothetical protein FSPOR_3331 [Fusarium sporotrichioides]|uniref:Uncharacterized protein n=1 Tax=Fusarium sporotrichioides TaxID=5514 RepID=A0A395SG90_FUSSP|nr:hypothetical protein FSPOR_3331 [Fusarium sporotrichioides]